MKRINLEAPWETFAKKVAALLANDPDIIVGELMNDPSERGDYALAIPVYNHEKFLALDRLLPGSKKFGNVTLSIDLYDEENAEVDTEGLFQTLFKDNPVFDSVQTLTDPAGGEWTYVVFRPEVIQFFDDDLTDVNGNWTGIAEDIAREVFAENARGVYFCTAEKQTDEE